MDSRLRGFEIAIPPTTQQAQSLIDAVAEQTPSWPSTTRPLSDIRELTEPSLIDAIVKPRSALQRKYSVTKPSPLARSGSGRSVRVQEPVVSKSQIPRLVPQGSSSSEASTTPEQSSFYTIPQASVPQRSSSQTHSRQTSKAPTRKPSIRTAPTEAPIFDGFTVPDRGCSHSPVKGAGLHIDAISADTARRVPSKTYIRRPHPLDILDYPYYKHPRIKLEIQVSAPIFAGGGTVEGAVKVMVDDNERLKHRKSLAIGAISVDLLGYEEVTGNRRAAFLALGTELLDAKHPPPATMIEINSPSPPDDKFWTLSPSSSTLPFRISLPLDTGPPPFQSRHASIKFMLSATAVVQDGDKYYRVRTSHEVQVLPTYDPEKALTSLPSPLTASDELHIPRSTGYESIKVTAGLHRQVWVSGGSIFVDVHISNKSRKSVRKLELNLERNILSYKHTAAMTREKSAGQARIFENNDQTNLAMNSLRGGTAGWSGVEPHSSETRTCDLELPRGYATVKCGKYFEVRYFLNIVASISNSKTICVQLPIILIHMNSLDIMPNSVAQVAAAIEEKRANHRRRSSESKATSRIPTRQRSVSSPACSKELRRRPSYTQGRAFAAPRQQSLERQRAEVADLDTIRQALDASPRKNAPPLRGFALKNVGSAMSFTNTSFTPVGGRSTPGSAISMGKLRGRPFETPPPKQRTFQLPTESETKSLRNRLRMIPSLDSVRSKKSTNRSNKIALLPLELQNVPPGRLFPSPRYEELDSIAPHTLGLTGSFDGTTALRDLILRAPQPPTPATKLREKLDRSRFEFKAVRRKASGGLKEKSLNLWEHVRHHREGWI